VIKPVSTRVVAIRGQISRHYQLIPFARLQLAAADGGRRARALGRPIIADRAGDLFVAGQLTGSRGQLSMTRRPRSLLTTAVGGPGIITIATLWVGWSTDSWA